jgi:hypothetical protein
VFGALHPSWFGWRYAGNPSFGSLHGCQSLAGLLPNVSLSLDPEKHESLPFLLSLAQGGHMLWLVRESVGAAAGKQIGKKITDMFIKYVFIASTCGRTTQIMLAHVYPSLS